MKKVILTLICMLACTFAVAQNHELTQYIDTFALVHKLKVTQYLDSCVVEQDEELAQYLDSCIVEQDEELTQYVDTFVVAQEHPVTEFLGIPVDGSESQMIMKLNQKGFVSDFSSPPLFHILRGKLNGYDVMLSPVTNNDKVFRIFIVDYDAVSAEQIKIRFNNLCRQFEEDSNYSAASIYGYFIPDDEDISYEMSVNDVSYMACYYQYPQYIDTSAVEAEARKIVSEALKSDEFSDEDRSETLEFAYSLCVENFLL